MDTAIDVIREALKEGDYVRMVGFGTFKAVERKARIGRNPKNPGKNVSIPACKAVVFKAGKELKAGINNK